MSESPEVERSTQNPGGKSNIEQGVEPPVDKTDPTEPVRVPDKKESPEDKRMKNMNRTDKIGTA